MRNAGNVSPALDKPLVECQECKERKLDEEIEHEVNQAAVAAWQLKAELADELLLQAELKVIREKLVGRSRLPDYWRAVRRKLEE